MLHCLMDVVSCQQCKLPLGTWSSGCYLKFAKPVQQNVASAVNYTYLYVFNHFYQERKASNFTKFYGHASGFIMAINVIRNNWNQFLFTSKPHIAKDFWLTELPRFVV